MALYAFDGTWNVIDSKDPLPSIGTDPRNARSGGRDTAETNVHRFMEYYGEAQSEYLQGVGTRWWWLGRLLGGAFGVGGKRRIRRMYRRLMQRYPEDRNINIIGFSRGAAMAVHFANLIAEHGIRDLKGKRRLGPWYYKSLGFTWRHPKARLDAPVAARVLFLGLWDTVATFGLPLRPFRNKLSTFEFNDVPDNVVLCAHAKALDETRPTFELVEVSSKASLSESTEDSTTSNVYDVWFRGVHSNIGGGYVDRGLSDITLVWMMEQAIHAWGEASNLSERADETGHGVPEDFDLALAMLDPGASRVQPESWRGTNLETLEPDPNGQIGRPASLRRKTVRVLGPGARVHHTVRLRDDDLIKDYFSSENRTVLNRVPRDAVWIHDPPVRFHDRREDFLDGVAFQVFTRIPVRPREWLRFGDDYIYRSDEWLAIGPKDARHARGPSAPGVHLRLDVFRLLVRGWLEKGMPEPEDDAEVLSWIEAGKEPALNELEVDLRERATRYLVFAALQELRPNLPWSVELEYLAERRSNDPKP